VRSKSLVFAELHTERDKLLERGKKLIRIGSDLPPPEPGPLLERGFKRGQYYWKETIIELKYLDYIKR